MDLKKTILVDLSALKNTNCGLGQVALSYANYFNLNYKKENAKYALTLLVPDEMIGKFGNEVAYISSTRKLTRRLQFLMPKFDVWHSTNQLSRFMPKHSGTKYILTIHDLNYLYERKGLKRIFKHFKVQKKVNRANQLVCISSFTKLEVERNLKINQKPIKVILNHVKQFDLRLATIHDKVNKSPFFFSIGVIRKKKNLHVLLDLMKLLPDKHLYIAGKEEALKEKNTYAQMIKDRIRDEDIKNVTLIGTITENEKIWMFNKCEALLFPSLYEGFGLPIIEAMQCGKPVFCSSETSLKEIGGQFAYFWNNFEALNMKSVIDENLEHFNNNKELMQQEIDYAMTFLSNKHFEEYEKLYETI